MFFFSALQMWCIVGSPFQNIVHILQWTVSSGTKPKGKTGTGAGLRRTVSQGDYPDLGSLDLDGLSSTTPGGVGGGITVLSS